MQHTILTLFVAAVMPPAMAKTLFVIAGQSNAEGNVLLDGLQKLIAALPKSEDGQAFLDADRQTARQAVADSQGLGCKSSWSTTHTQDRTIDELRASRIDWRAFTQSYQHPTVQILAAHYEHSKPSLHKKLNASSGEADLTSFLLANGIPADRIPGSYEYCKRTCSESYPSGSFPNIHALQTRNFDLCIASCDTIPGDYIGNGDCSAKETETIRHGPKLVQYETGPKAYSAEKYSVISFEPLAAGFGMKYKAYHESVHTRSFGMELSFGTAIAEKVPDAALLKVAMGGASLGDTWRTDGPLYSQLVQETKDALQQQQANLGGLIWFQGYNDQFPDIWCHDMYSAYEFRLHAFITKFRADVGVDVPVVIVKARNGGNLDIIQQAQEAVASALSRVSVVPSADLSDCFHYDAGSQIVIGERVAAAMVDLLDATATKTTTRTTTTTATTSTTTTSTTTTTKGTTRTTTTTTTTSTPTTSTTTTTKTTTRTTTTTATRSTTTTSTKTTTRTTTTTTTTSTTTTSTTTTTKTTTRTATTTTTTSCSDGDVSFRTDEGELLESLPASGAFQTPWVSYGGVWYPICGHYFWDNNNGATAFCKKLGYTSGSQTEIRTSFSVSSMPVGKCSWNQELASCNGGGNAWGNLDYRGGWCKAGKNIKVSVKCSGGSSPTVSSCHANPAPALAPAPLAKPCMVPAVTNGGWSGTGCTTGANVGDGTVCTVTADYGYTCTAASATCSHGTLIAPTCEAKTSCSDGDVSFRTDQGDMLESLPASGALQTPWVSYGGVWYPICGHFFWDNHHGATAFCKKLGYTSGSQTKIGTSFSVSSMPIGRCSWNQELASCNGGGNAWGNLNYRGGWCNAGKNIKVSVKCSGGSSPTVSSCQAAVSRRLTESAASGAAQIPTNEVLTGTILV